MKINTRTLRNGVIGSLTATTFISLGASAADDTNAMNAKIDVLEKQIQTLRDLIKDSRAESASKGELSALKKEVQVVKETSANTPRNKIATLGGVEVTTSGDMQQWFVYSSNPKFSDNGAVASNKGNFSFYANPSTLTGLGYSSQNYNDIKGKTDKDVRDAEASPFTRYRQWFTSSSADQKIKGVWAVEIGGGRWGNQSDSVGKSKGFGYSGDGVNVETRWLYMDFEVPGVSGRELPAFNPFHWEETSANFSGPRRRLV